MELVLVFAIVLVAGVLLSGLAHRTVLSTTVLFLVAGFVLGHGVTGVLDLKAGDPTVTVLVKVVLFTVLFTDGQRIGFHDLRTAWRLPGRALALGMPIAFAISTVLAVLLVGLSWPEALLVSAVLAPTDPLFASAIVGRPEIPSRLRRLLNVESGLNDAVALPAVLILLSVVGARHTGAAALAAELGAGLLIGVGVPLAVAFLLRVRWINPTGTYTALAPVAAGVAIFGLTQLVGANAYLAAFSAGVTITSFAPELRDAFREFGELTTELLKLLTILVFGSLVSPKLLAEVPAGGYAFAVLLLVLARPVGVELALLGSRMRRYERLTAAWFGPKGFSSVLYGMLMLNAGAPDAGNLFHLVVVAIVISMMAHSSTDVPIATFFAHRDGASDADQ